MYNKFIGILKGTGKLVLLIEGPSYSGSQLSRVYCSNETLLSEAYKQKQLTIKVKESIHYPLN